MVHPDKPEIVCGGAQGSRWAATEERGVYRSTDGGETSAGTYGNGRRTIGRAAAATRLTIGGVSATRWPAAHHDLARRAAGHILRRLLTLERAREMAMAGCRDKWLQSFVPWLLYRITNQLNRKLRSRLRREGVNVSRWRVLAVLHAHGDLTLGGIADLTAMEQPSVSRIVSQLVQEGLVRRNVSLKVSLKDSRFVHVELAPAGERAFQSIYPTAEKHQERALRGFSAGEIRILTRFLRRIQANIDRQE